MKNKDLYITWMLVAMSVLLLTMSCKEKEESDGNAGSFIITNLSTGDVITDKGAWATFGLAGSTKISMDGENFKGRGVRLHKGDTIKVDFKPKSIYMNHNFIFSMSCTYFEKIDNELFVIPDLFDEYKHNNTDVFVKPITIVVSAHFEGKVDDVKYNLNAKREFVMDVLSFY